MRLYETMGIYEHPGIYMGHMGVYQYTGYITYGTQEYIGDEWEYMQNIFC